MYCQAAAGQIPEVFGGVQFRSGLTGQFPCVAFMLLPPDPVGSAMSITSERDRCKWGLSRQYLLKIFRNVAQSQSAANFIDNFLYRVYTESTNKNYIGGFRYGKD